MSCEKHSAEKAEEVAEAPELLAAVDEGLRSAESEPTYTLDEVRTKIAKRTSNSLKPRATVARPSTSAHSSRRLVRRLNPAILSTLRV
jgi:hypothetical protein